MISGILLLPLELLVHLNQYIHSTKDRYELCLVNHSMYDFFRDHIFYTIQFHSPEQVANTCRRLSEKPRMFNQIRQISINTNYAPTCPYSTFLRYCPNLEQLTLGEHFWTPVNDDDDDDDDTSNDTWDEMLVDLDEYLLMTRLMVLDVDCKRAYGVDDLFPLLMKCPHLKILKLRSLLWLTMPTDIERVHQLCPGLTTLLLDHQHAIPNLTDDLPPTTTTLPIEEQTRLTMRHLDFFHEGLWDDFVPWLHYIACHYPHLRTLKISMEPSWFTASSQQQPSDTLHVGQLNHAVRQLVHSCKKLESVSFNRVWWAKDFFKCRINHHQQEVMVPLQQVTLLGHDDSAVYYTTRWWEEIDKTFHLFTVSDGAHVQSLTISMQPQPYFKPLRLAHALVQLNLVAPDHQRSKKIDPRFFLTICPSLLSLVITGGLVTLDHDQHLSMPQQHLLTRFSLCKCFFTNAILASMARLCPVLRTLTMTACTLEEEEEEEEGKNKMTSVQLMFPHHVFSLIELNQVRMSGGMSRRLRPIEFITISRHHTTGSAPTLTLIPRYYIPNPHILPTRASMKRLAASGGPYQHKTQSFKVTLMRYRYRNDYDDIDSPPIETIVSVKCLSHREVAYYQQQAGVPLLGTVTDSWKKQRRLKDYDDNRQMEKDIGQKHQTMGGHILVNVYGVAGLNVNGKWLVL